jgi:hypothetical protein
MSAERTGAVVRQSYAPGSKSERDAVMLVTDGEQYLLRREGGNPFHDPELDALVGKRLRCRGTIHGSTFILAGWEVLGDAG